MCERMINMNEYTYFFIVSILRQKYVFLEGNRGNYYLIQWFLHENNKTVNTVASE